MALDQAKLKKAIPRLDKEAVIWFATVRPDGRPHLIPIWHVWHDGKIWICTPDGTQKVRNLEKNPNAVVSLEDGMSPVILEGTAAPRRDASTADRIAPLFHKKFDWDFRDGNDEGYILIEFTPTRVVSW